MNSNTEEINQEREEGSRLSDNFQSNEITSNIENQKDLFVSKNINYLDVLPIPDELYDSPQNQIQTKNNIIQNQEIKEGCCNKTYKKKPFSIEEDKYLSYLVDSIGINKWSQIADLMKKAQYNRSGRQCRDRYLHYLDPKLNNSAPWSSDEDQNLINWVNQYGKKWKMMEKLLPGRTEVSIRNRYNLILRKAYRDLKKINVKRDIMSDSFAFLDLYKRYKKKKSTKKKDSIQK